MISHFGLGGEVPTIIYDAKTKKVVIINGQGPAPKAATRVHEAIKLSYDDRNAYYGDPDFTEVPMQGLLSKPYAAERRKQIGRQALLDQGGKRPRSTLSPTVVLKDGRPFLAISTPGGDSQDQQILNVLLALFVFGMDLQQAIEAPRVNSLHPFSSFDAHESLPGTLEVEQRVRREVVKALQARGHKIRPLGPYGMSTGVVAVGVNLKTGTLRGGADVRRERYVFGW